MRNWDNNSCSNANGGNSCMTNVHYQDAVRVANKLCIPLHRTSFESSYWTEVFESKFLGPISRGWTPNPDVWCNREIKFGALWKWANDNGPFDFLATGHYANINIEKEGKDNSGSLFLPFPSLHKAVDLSKDQTYFLAQIKREILPRIMFPVGKLKKKTQIVNLAIEAGLEWLTRKDESMGICFIEAKNKNSFLNEFIDPNERRGPIVDYENGRQIGFHHGSHLYTIGQCIRLHSQQSR